MVHQLSCFRTRWPHEINFKVVIKRLNSDLVVMAGFSLGGILACSVHTKILDLANISTRIRENLVCITFAQPHVPVPGLNKLARYFPEVVSSTVHSVQLEMDLVPRLLGLLHQPPSKVSKTINGLTTHMLET